MADSKLPQEIYWVVGTGTNVGKTTIASALIKVLNESGIPSVGFKPFGALRVKESIEFMLEFYPGSNCLLFGSDAQKLTRASPLTDEKTWADVVAPYYSLFNTRAADPILMRTGSYCLQNVEYFTAVRNANLLRRADYRRLFEKCGLPYEQAKTFDPRVEDADEFSRGKVIRAFDRLLTLNPKAIVCEGASAYLPFWRDGPLPNHVFVVTHDLVHFYRDMKINKPLEFTARSTVGDISTSTSRTSSPLFVMESQGRDSMMKKTVRHLLQS